MSVTKANVFRIYAQTNSTYNQDAFLKKFNTMVLSHGKNLSFSFFFPLS